MKIEEVETFVRWTVLKATAECSTGACFRFYESDFPSECRRSVSWLRSFLHFVAFNNFCTLANLKFFYQLHVVGGWRGGTMGRGLYL